LEQSITAKTKILMLCNPQNPTGKVFSEEELIKISDIAKRHNLLIVSDEIHCDLILDENAKHIPISTISDYANQNTITLQAPSKTYNIAGLNTAFVIIPDKSIRENFVNGIGESIPLVNVLGYQALIAAYNKSELWRLELIEYLRNNREIVYNFVKKHPLLNMIKPQATYLAWIDISLLLGYAISSVPLASSIKKSR
jgi:cystathionine beta-lyase